MKQYVYVKTEFEGMHFWLEAPEEVKFLRNPHRHKFFVTLELETHTDRQVEFFMLKNELDLFLMPYRLRDNIGSCEMVAKDIAIFFGDKYKTNAKVVVNEDNENGAIAETKYDLSIKVLEQIYTVPASKWYKD